MREFGIFLGGSYEVMVNSSPNSQFWREKRLEARPNSPSAPGAPC